MNLSKVPYWFVIPTDNHVKKWDIKNDKDRRSPNNRNRLSWWFPKIPKDILVPKTVIIPYEAQSFDGEWKNISELCQLITNAGDLLGWPLFLRTDYLSDKHNWKNTCYVPKQESVFDNICALDEMSMMADIHGFPQDMWIARKMIPTTPAFYAFHGEMPIVKERRYFVQDDKVVCHHPYWPTQAFLMGDLACEYPRWEKLLDEMNVESDSEITLLSGLSSRVGAAIGGSWSIDWLWSEPEGKWYLTDMAEADVSYHWPECSVNFGP